jgi:hypothetical protein
MLRALLKSGNADMLVAKVAAYVAGVKEAKSGGSAWDGWYQPLASVADCAQALSQYDAAKGSNDPNAQLDVLSARCGCFLLPLLLNFPCLLLGRIACVELAERR